MIDMQDFRLERYKYILGQKRSLNEATFKIAAIYQALIVALSLAQFKVIAMLIAKSITLDVALFSSLCLLALLAVLSILILSLLMGGIISWLKYRDDEREIELTVFGASRAPVMFRNIFRWYETYIALVVIVVFLSALWVYLFKLMPLLKLLGGN